MLGANHHTYEHVARYVSLLLVPLVSHPSLTTLATGQPETRNRTEATQTANVEEAKRLIEEIGRFFGAGRYSEAIPLSERLLVIYEAELGPDR